MYINTNHSLLLLILINNYLSICPYPSLITTEKLIRGHRRRVKKVRPIFGVTCAGFAYTHLYTNIYNYTYKYSYVYTEKYIHMDNTKTTTTSGQAETGFTYTLSVRPPDAAKSIFGYAKSMGTHGTTMSRR